MFFFPQLCTFILIFSSGFFCVCVDLFSISALILSTYAHQKILQKKKKIHIYLFTHRQREREGDTQINNM